MTLTPCLPATLVCPAGWCHHPLATKRYHFIIPAASVLEDPTTLMSKIEAKNAGVPNLFFVPPTTVEEKEAEFNAPTSAFDSSTHHLHGIVHVNGRGHLLRIAARDGTAALQLQDATTALVSSFSRVRQPASRRFGRPAGAGSSIPRGAYSNGGKAAASAVATPAAWPSAFSSASATPNPRGLLRSPDTNGGLRLSHRRAAAAGTDHPGSNSQLSGAYTVDASGLRVSSRHAGSGTFAADAFAAPPPFSDFSYGSHRASAPRHAGAAAWEVLPAATPTLSLTARRNAVASSAVVEVHGSVAAAAPVAWLPGAAGVPVTALSGPQLMTCWDQLCGLLCCCEVSVEDVSNKNGMLLRTLHTVAVGETW